MTDTYGVDFRGFIDNVRKCNNRDPSERNPTRIELGDDRYPPCFFGVTYVSAGGGVDWPLAEGGCQNRETVPDWVFGETVDNWNEPRDKLCLVDEYKDVPVCNR